MGQGNGGTTRQRRDRARELRENRSVTAKVVKQTPEDRERIRRDSEWFFQQRGEAMRGGRP